MADVYDLIEPETLTRITRLLIAEEDRAVNAPRLLNWFPSVEVQGIQWEADTGTNRDFTELMPFRAFTTEAPIGKRWGTTRKSGELPPLSKKYLLTEYDRIKERSLNRNSPGLADLIELSVVGSIQQGVRAALRTMEYVASQCIFDGAIDFSSDDPQNGMNIQVDWGRNPSNTSTVTESWADPFNATPDDDEEAVMEYMEDTHNIPNTELVAVMNRYTYKLWRATEQVRSRFNSVRVLDRLSDAALQAVRADADLPPILIINSQIKDWNGVTRKVVPDGKVAYLPANAVLGALQWGVPAMADEPEINLEYQDRPGMIAYLMREVDPLKVWTVVDGIGLPTMLDPDASYVLDVIP